jgi:hypothetical protein
MNDPLATSQPHSAIPAGSPFRHRAFTVIWISTVVSNIGGWMYNVASGWLMTSLDSNAAYRARDGIGVRGSRLHIPRRDPSGEAVPL